MSEISRVALFGKLNRSCPTRASRERRSSASSRGNPYVELAMHWLHQLIQASDSNLRIASSSISRSTPALAHWRATSPPRSTALPRSATAISMTSRCRPSRRWCRKAGCTAPCSYGESAVRTGLLVVGAVKTPDAAQARCTPSPGEFRKIKPDDLFDDFAQDRQPARLGGHPGRARRLQRRQRRDAGEASGAIAPAQLGKREALKKVTVDSALHRAGAQRGKMDPIVNCR